MNDRAAEYERRQVYAGAGVLCLLMAAHALLETSRDALFLRTLPSDYLPWVYLLIAALAFLVTWQKHSSSAQKGGRATLPVMISASALITGGFWFVCEWPSTWLLMALYVWSGVYATLMTVHFWLSLSARYTITEAKRLFGTVGAGGIAGAIAGSGAARAIAGSAETRHMLLLAAACMAAAGPLAFWVLGQRRPLNVQDHRDPLWSEFKALRGSQYLRRLTLLVIIATMASTLANFLFKREVSRVVAPEDLSVFFATTYVVVNVVSLLVQVFAVGWLLDRFGAHRALCILPVLLLAGGTAFAAGTGLVAALLLQGADGILKYSVYRTSVEVMYVPIPTSLRPAAKSMADVLGHRGGQALASLGILALLLLPAGGLAVSLVLVGLCVGWVVVSLGLRRHYLDLFRRTLTENTMAEGTAPLDKPSLESLFSALNSPVDERVIAAVELLASHGKMRLVPALILHHPSKKVVVRCLELFSEGKRDDFVPVAMRLLSHPDSEVRAAALRAATAFKPRADFLHDAMEDETPDVRAIAIVHLVHSKSIDSKRGVRELTRLIQSPSSHVRLAVARALAVRPTLELAPILRRLAADVEVNVRVEALAAIEKCASPEFVDVLLEAIAERRTRVTARAALLAIGDPAFEALATALGNPDVPLRTRLHIPRSLSHFEPSRAAVPLLRELVRERQSAVHYKILRALGHLRSRTPELMLDPEELHVIVERTIEEARATLLWSVALSRGDYETQTPAKDLLFELAEDKRNHLVERIFRLLSLMSHEEDFRGIHRGLSSPVSTIRSGAIELLSSSLEERYRDALLGVVSDEPLELRLERLGVSEVLRYEDALEDMRHGSSETIAAFATYHLDELNSGTGSGERADRVGSTASAQLQETIQGGEGERSPLEDL